MKRLLSILLSLVLVGSLAACGGNAASPAPAPAPAPSAPAASAATPASPAPSSTAPSSAAASTGKLVLYCASAQDMLDATIPAFEEATGIKVEVVTASTGEVYKRIQAEKDNPSADVIWIGTAEVYRDTSYFESYVSANNAELPVEYQSKDGYINAVNQSVPVIIYNKNLVDFEIKGYKDLLNPKLFGKIAHGDAAKSASAYNHLENMLLAMGGGDPNSDQAWKYVSDFMKQLDKKIVDSSGAIHKGVVSGEYAVGMTWDTPAMVYLSQGVDHIGVTFMEEGVVPKTAGVAIIKNCKNMDSAKKFADFMNSKAAQERLAQVPGGNPIRSDIERAAYNKGMVGAKVIPLDYEWSTKSKKDIQARYQDLYLQIFE